jgi:cytochrome c oxidase assembly protein subunit 15
MTAPSDKVPAAVSYWLWSIAFLILCMVIVGGATRLTDSGLSITEWKPLLGAIPPLNEAHWLEAFEKYKLIPEYQVQNRGMSLDEFKFIYWWEWAHRFLGRIIGFVFIVPLLYFVAVKAIPRRLWPRLFLLFVLGGAQGALGWFMVASGLSERVDVSQYRLAAHLTFAFALFAGTVWTVLGLNCRRRWLSVPDNMIAAGLVVLVFLQVAAGGFVAGLDAGFASNTWPKMNGEWVPAGLFMTEPHWKNFFENALTVQFNHRLMAYGILAYVLWMARRVPRTGWFVAAAVLAQMLLGILTVVWNVPLAVALIHQGGALVLLALALWHLHRLLSQPVQLRFAQVMA